MRIAMFSENFYPELSGIADSILDTGRELARRGHQVDFYVPRYALRNYQAVNLENKKELNFGNNIRITRFHSWPFIGSGTRQGRIVLPSFWRWWQIRKFLPDIIHTNLFFGVGLEALIAAKLLKIPLIGTNHTVVSEFMRYSPLKGKRITAKMLNYVNWYYNHCDLVTAPGAALLKEMEGQGLKVSHRVVSNPLDNEKFFLLKKEVREKIKKELRLTNYTLVYAGRLAEEKSIDVLIKSLPKILAKIPDVTLLVVGQGNILEKLKKLTQKLKVDHTVKFLGTVDKERLNKIYNAAEVFTIASTSEVQSMTILQAMACGLPIIGVAARGVTDVVKDNGFLFSPGDSAELAEKVIWFFQNTSERKKMEENGLAEARKFSKENIASEWEKIYQEVIKKRQLFNFL